MWKTQLIVTIDQNKSLYIIDFDNHNYITLGKCINFAGKTIPSILLVSGVNILYKRYQHNDLNRDIGIGITESSNANDNIVLEWL